MIAQAQLRAANKPTALTARRARPVLGIGMYHASTAVLSAPSAPT
ncbi:amino acid transporter [Xanthomonas oryzae pv. oryzae]|nr:amino acid transporter [Xanthomonas oryzae pv. oryzae PXO86]ALZ70483.1 amino acid transporter [Xanthomonas oryzae pv. oryzae]AOS04175.1 amino acid transporter [Xanthomonas oryzae pv. oryzae]AOS09310.1 amino acid transporter [Xanthomonas oryzae pv. oryzae]AOS20803.1 amino acid transporter [Xanthomonas oryzae pv. oryzae]